MQSQQEKTLKTLRKDITCQCNKNWCKKIYRIHILWKPTTLYKTNMKTNMMMFRNRSPSLADLLDQPRRSGRKREDKSYVECPDIVIEEDYLSKPSPAKKANLGGPEPQPVKKPNSGQTNGIEMESDEDDDEEIFPPLPPPQVQ